MTVYVAIGILITIAAVVFVLMPLFRGVPGPGPTTAEDDAALQREFLYRQIVELEQDQAAGKVSAEDAAVMSAALLQRASALIPLGEALSNTLDAQIEQEIVAVRQALGARLQAMPEAAER